MGTAAASGARLMARRTGQHRRGAAEGRFGVVSKTRLWNDDHPFGFAERGVPGGKSLDLRQSFEITEEDGLACAVQIPQPAQK